MLTSLPNLLTLSRILIIPVFMVLVLMDEPLAGWIAFGLFVAAAVTDYLDGYLARRQSQVSNLGRFLDPIADKLLVAAAIIMLVALERAPVVAAIIILCRELLISGLREYLAELNATLPVSRLAKWKTGVQLVAVGVLLIAHVAPYPAGFPLTLLEVGAILFWIAALLSVITAWDYVRVGVREMLDKPYAPARRDADGADRPVT